LLERRLRDLGLGGVDLDWGRLSERDALGQLAHLLGLILSFGEGHANVEDVRSAFYLVLGDRHEAVVVVFEQKLLGPA
jgi:hypothetical protein